MHKKWRVVVSISVAAMLILSVVVAGCAAPTPAPTPTPAPAESPTLHLKAAQAMMTKTSITHLDMVEMCEAITKRTDGKVTWDIFGPEIGDWLELERMCMKGTIDLQFNAFDTTLDPRWNIAYLPFLVSSWDEARVVYAKGGPYDAMGKLWAPDGDMYYLGTWINNMGSIGLNRDPVLTPEQAKGVKIRVFPMEIGKCYIEKMGFTSVTMPWSEAPTAIATGVADGWIGSGAVYHYDLFRDIARTMVVTYDFGEMWAVTMNLDRWESLPEGYKVIFQEEADRIIEKHLGQVEEEEMYYQKKLVEECDWTIVDMAKDYPKELEVWKNLARECWDVFEPVVGKIWMDRLKELMGMEVVD